MRASRVFGIVGLLFGVMVGAASPAQAANGPWVQVAGGDGHTCAISAAKSLFCWGANTEAQAGDGGAQNPRESPFRVGAAGVWSSVSVGSLHSCGITTAKNLYCWGYNGYAQVGDGTTNSPRLNLFRVGASGVWSSVSSSPGSNHTCGITTAKNLYCWGYNQYGQVGDGTVNTPRESLFRVGAAGVWSRVSAGEGHTCGITTAKNLYCWGWNGSGEIGDRKAMVPRLNLFRVGAAGVWTSVITENGATCGITTAKNLYCWGFNDFGEIGTGTRETPQLALHRVGAAGVWSRVAGGNYHTCGVTTAKNLYCWGLNDRGQVGDGTTNSPRLTMNRVAAAGVWSSVAAGAYHTCGITTAGNLYCWGYNGDAGVGDGTTTTPRLTLFRVV